MPSELDNIDRKLLGLLQENGRTPFAELGKAVGLSISSANERVRKLHDRGAYDENRTHWQTVPRLFLAARSTLRVRILLCNIPVWSQNCRKPCDGG